VGKRRHGVRGRGARGSERVSGPVGRGSARAAACDVALPFGFGDVTRHARHGSDGASPYRAIPMPA